MKSRSPQAFTLIEMLIVMVIIAVITGLVMGVAGLANTKAARARAQGEITALSSACESYKTDNGVYPRQGGTTEAADDTSAPPLDPRVNGDPSSQQYWDASLFLYQQLWGDADLDGKGGDNGVKTYMDPKPNMLGYGADKKHVAYLQDPWGFSYGYSTAGAKAEDVYRQKAQTEVKDSKKTAVDDDRGYKRDSAKVYGYNSSFDLWSTAGTKNPAPTDSAHAKWMKNW
jgi:prepilin-type N-terminal cleavage/methylation domain-containing protein